MRVVDTDGFGVTAYMEHTCGHEMGYFFGAEKFAQLYQEKYESLPCQDNILERIQNVRHV